MSEQLSPLCSVEVSERGQRALDRLKEIFGVDQLPDAFVTLAGSENAINDLYMNLNRQLADGNLERSKKLLIATAVASAVGSPKAVEFFSKAALGAGRTAAELLEGIGVASTCTVFNGHYRFRDHVAEEDKATYEAFRAPFNANVFVKAALPMDEVEAVCIAVSSANGCHKCVQGHVAKGKAVGLNDEQIDEIIRAASAALAASNVAKALAGLAAPTAETVA
jgi:AhpD family alkylhydroperoxidase